MQKIPSFRFCEELPQFLPELLDLCADFFTLRFPEKPLVQCLYIVVHVYRLLLATHNTATYGE